MPGRPIAIVVEQQQRQILTGVALGRALEAPELMGLDEPPDIGPRVVGHGPAFKEPVRPADRLGVA